MNKTKQHYITDLVKRFGDKHNTLVGDKEGIIEFISAMFDAVQEDERKQTIELYKPVIKLCERYHDRQTPTTQEIEAANQAIAEIAQQKE